MANIDVLLEEAIAEQRHRVRGEISENMEVCRGRVLEVGGTPAGRGGSRRSEGGGGIIVRSRVIELVGVVGLEVRVEVIGDGEEIRLT